MAGRRSTGGYGGGGGVTSDQERLRMYDAAVAAPQKMEQQSEKLDFLRQKEAFSEAQRQAGTEIRQKQLESSNAFKDQQLQSLQAERDSKQAQMDATQAQQDLKNNHTKEVATAAASIFKGLSGMDRTDPKFQANLYSLLADNPAAADHPAVMKAVEHELNTFTQQQSLKAKAQAMNPTAAFQDSLAASQPIYGTADPNGKNFVGTVAGQDPQTHVQVTYLPPGAKQPVTQVLPRTVFDSAVAASQSRQQQSAPAPDATVVAPPVAAPITQPVAPVAAPSVPQPETVQSLIANPTAPVPPPDIHDSARAAIQAGAPRDAVIQRLQQLGGDPSKL